MLEQDQCGLIVVDIQGKLARLMHESEAFIAQTELMIRAYRALTLPVLYLEHCVDKLGPTVPELADALDGVDPIRKTSFGACGEATFHDALDRSGRRQWLICGIEAHVCVYQTALGLAEMGHQVEVVADCISSRQERNIELALAKLNRLGIESTTMEMALFELMKNAEHPQFRQIVALLQ